MSILLVLCALVVLAAYIVTRAGSKKARARRDFQPERLYRSMPTSRKKSVPHRNDVGGDSGDSSRSVVDGASDLFSWANTSSSDCSQDSGSGSDSGSCGDSGGGD